MNPSSAFVLLVQLFPLLLVSTLLWFSVQTRRGVYFGISVPLGFVAGPAGLRIAKRFRAGIFVVTLTAMAIDLTGLALHRPWLVSAAVLSPVIGGLILWQLARHAVRPHGIVPAIERSTSFDTEASPVWLAVMIAALFPLSACWLYLRHNWDRIPSLIPVHWNFNGTADRYTARSIASLSAPLLMGVAVIVLLLLCCIVMRFSAVADRQRSTRIMFPAMSALAWSLSLVFCWISLLPLRSTMSPSMIALVALGHMLVVAAIVAFIMLQLTRIQGAEPYDGTADSSWHAGGLIYYNPADAALLVPKRFGWGWTLNFGRPAAWGYTCVIILLVAVLGVASSFQK